MNVTVAATQMACDWNRDGNVARAERLVREAVGRGAQVVLIQELFESPYFCKDHLASHFALAHPVEGHPAVAHFAALASELGVVLPLSIFERASNAYFNTLVMVDADGSVLGRYRKSHIPEGPGYHEKYYFSPGDTGFKVWNTRYGKLGVGICWDQWFPECARAMALMGAEMLLYPTAISSEPPAPGYDSQPHWELVMRGHAAANILPVVASNRIGTEIAPQGRAVTFYGSSFIADPAGKLVATADRVSEGVLVHRFDLDAIAALRAGWGLFRDRRVDLYGAVQTLDGVA